MYAFENVDNYGRPLGNTRKDRIRNDRFRSDAMVEPITTHVTQKRFSWYGHVMRKDTNVAKKITTMKVGGKRPPRKAQSEVDGQSAMHYERTPTRTKSRTEPRSMEKGCRGDRPRTGIRSAEVSKGE